jgi:hypothetical protein
MRRSLLPALLLAALPVDLPAQDKALEAVCGNLAGARQTAIRMRDSGFPLQVTLNETLARPEWRGASMQHQQLAVRVVQEVYTAPHLQTSEIVRDTCRAALDAPRSK